MCAKSDDPITINQNYRAIQLDVGATDGSNVSGTVDLSFLGYTTTMGASLQTAGACEDAWEALDNVEAVACNATAAYDGCVSVFFGEKIE